MTTEPRADLDPATLVPDDKDWTWVLERPCPECGFVAREVDLSTVGTRIRATADRFTEVLRRPHVAQRQRADRWSDLEYSCHVRDVYRICRGRLELILTADDAHFANWDQDATAIDDRYGEQDPAVVAAELVEAAGAIATAFDDVIGDQWQRRGHRSDGAVFTVDSFARYVLHDPLHHLWDVGATEEVAASR
ncbi:MAG: DinB family protein [Acidimicrobiia bacterium]|nr:DinB family protein [Acidimicrobiia bacterium]